MRIFLDSADRYYDTHQLSGRAAMSAGNHTLKIELHARHRIFTAEVHFDTPPNTLLENERDYIRFC